MPTEWHFPVMIAASLIEFVLVLWLVIGRATFVKRRVAVAVVAVVVVFGMAFGKFGVTLGLPWWIYYPVPALITVALPPLMRPYLVPTDSETSDSPARPASRN